MVERKNTRSSTQLSIPLPYARLAQVMAIRQGACLNRRLGISRQGASKTMTGGAASARDEAHGRDSDGLRTREARRALTAIAFRLLQCRATFRAMIFGDGGARRIWLSRVDASRSVLRRLFLLKAPAGPHGRHQHRRRKSMNTIVPTTCGLRNEDGILPALLISACRAVFVRWMSYFHATLINYFLSLSQPAF